MTTFAQNILVATDFSTASFLAVDAASLLAQALNARVTLVHVFDPAPFAAAAMPLQPIDMIGSSAEMVERIQNGLQELRDSRIKATTEADVRIVEHPSAAEGICECARELGSDLIIVATHGRTGLAHLLLGSVAEHVVRNAPCPVLTLRSKAS